MKLLIKFVIIWIAVVVLILYIGLSIYGKPLVANIASLVLHADVEIGRVKFVPGNMSLQLDRVKIPEWEMTFSKGAIHLVPLRLRLQGLEKGDFLLLEDRLTLQIQARNFIRTWEIRMGFNGVNLLDLSSLWPEAWGYGFSKGILDGKIDGTYAGKDCKLYGVLHFYNMAYDESSAKRPNGPLGIPIEEIVEFIRDNNGSIDLDFTYKGPLDSLNDPFRYRPGPKIIRSLGAYLIKKIS